MNSTGRVQSWLADPSTLGPIYPFVGWEVLMFLLSLAFCVGFMVWKFRFETAHYRERVAALREGHELRRAVEGQSDAEAEMASK